MGEEVKTEEEEKLKRPRNLERLFLFYIFLKREKEIRRVQEFCICQNTTS